MMPIFHEIAVARMATELVEVVADKDVDMQIKIAALESAAAILRNSVSSAALAATLANILLPPRR